MALFKKKRNQGVALWLNGDDAKDLLCPDGYKPLSQNEEIRRCVFKIADTVSNMTIMLMENGEFGDNRIKNELSRKLDICPNSYTTRKHFVHSIVTDMCIYGNAVVLPTYQDGYLYSLDLLDASSCHYRATPSGYDILFKGKVLNSSDVLHFVLNPKDTKRFEGDGFTNMLIDTISTLVQANTTKKAFLKSKWKPSLVITLDTDAEELMDAEKRSKILGSYTKTTEIGEPWLIPAGEIDVKTITPMTLQDLAISDSINLDLKAIACCFGVPSFMVGIGEFDKSEYNNFIATTVHSIAEIIGQELTRQLIISPNWYIKFNEHSLLQYDLQEKVTYIKEMLSGGVISRNEARNEINKSPVDIQAMNDYNVLENYIPVDRLGDQNKLSGGDNDDEDT